MRLLFNNAVNLLSAFSFGDGSMSLELCWNGADRRKLKYWDWILSYCHFVMHWSGIEPSLRGERTAINRLNYEIS
jgi:hypothetical protein